MIIAYNANFANIVFQLGIFVVILEYWSTKIVMDHSSLGDIIVVWTGVNSAYCCHIGRIASRGRV